MPAWLLPAALGMLSTAGTILTNRSNRKQVDDQIRFQERMSSTAAQRSVEDYRKAGLNPGLAYDRSASSPGGAAATMGDPISAGISSAQGARALQQQLRIAKEQHQETLMNTRASTQKMATEAKLAEYQQDLLLQQWKFNEKAQPAELRHKQAMAILQEYLVPGAKNVANFENKLGTDDENVFSARNLLQLYKTLRK